MLKNNIISFKDKTRFMENTAHRVILIEEGRYAIPTHKVHKNKKAYDRKIIKKLAFILLFMVTFGSFAQKNDKHVPCDCMDTAKTTFSMMYCAIRSYEKADKELNVQYNLLFNMLSDSAKIDFKICQLFWIKERELTFKAFDNIYSEGSMYKVECKMQKTDFVKKRAEFLYNLRFDLLEDRN